MWVMLAKLSAATLGYVLITGLLWYFGNKKQKRGRAWRIAVGLIFGACSVAANHGGIDYYTLLLNVRDIGPLAAGLFFSPVSGVIAGTIGGVERILAGEIWDIGKFTEIACGLSTFLAGVLAAILNRTVYQGKRPPVFQALFLGAVTEVFHMYAVLFTNPDRITEAYYVVETAALPMIAFTAAGMALCSFAVMKLGKETSDIGWRIPEEKTPVTVLFQRALLLVIVGLFLFNWISSYNRQTRLVLQNNLEDLQFYSMMKKEIFREAGGEDDGLEALSINIRQIAGTREYYLIVDGSTGDVTAHPQDIAIEKVKPEDLETIRGQAGKDPAVRKMATLAGLRMLCSVDELTENRFLVILLPETAIYDTRDAQMYETVLSSILLFTVLYLLVVKLSERLVVRNLHRVNESLHRITSGDLDETVWVHTSSEFTALSEDINTTVTALKGYIEAAKQKMKDELKLAAAIQDATLPKNFDLKTDLAELYALMTPAREVGGDFYDFFYCEPDQLCMVIADVSGKGVPASLFMMRAQTAIRNNARNGLGPAELLAKVNNILCEGNDAEMFVTVWIGILDLKTGQMRCANAGHEYPVLMRYGGDYELLKDRHGLVLAAMENVRQKEYGITLTPGDRLFVYTDGVPEAINRKEEAYGTERLTIRLNRSKHLPQERVLADVLQDIRNFAGGAEQFDDITMMGITYSPGGVNSNEAEEKEA